MTNAFSLSCFYKTKMKVYNYYRTRYFYIALGVYPNLFLNSRLKCWGPALIGLIILISCVLIMGNYQFNKNIAITIVWIILEAYYICYEILIGDLIEKIPFLLNLNYGFQAQCIYVILSGVFPLIGYVMFRSKRALNKE